MAEPPRGRAAPLPTISRLVRAMSVATTVAGVVEIAADLSHRLVRMPVGVLIIDGPDVPVIAGAPLDDRYALLFAAQARTGPWRESFRTGRPLTCRYELALSRDWVALATAMGYGGISAIDIVPLHVSARSVGVLSVFRSGKSTASELRARDTARDFTEVGLTTLSLRHRLGGTADETGSMRERLRRRNVVSLATGIMAGRHGMTPTAAAVALQALAYRLAQPLEQVAWLVAEGRVRSDDLTASVRAVIESPA